MVRRLVKKHNSLLFVTDIHGRLFDVLSIVQHITEQPVDAIILGGDIPGYTKKSFHDILRPLSKLAIPIIVLPGSHENESIYSVVEKYSIWDTTSRRNWLVRYGDQELIFVPGSGVLATGEKKFTGGSYQLTTKTLTASEKRKRSTRLKEMQVTRKTHYFSLPEILNYVKTYTEVSGTQKLVFAHVPLLQKTKRGIDYAQFCVPKTDFELNGKIIKVGEHVFPLDEAKDIGMQYFNKISKNVGHKGLNEFLTSLRCTKFFCGHIHEAGKRALDNKENKIVPGNVTKEFYLNSGEQVITRISFPSKDTVSYKFITL